MKPAVRLTRAVSAALLIVVAVVGAGCSSGPDKIKPTELAPNPALLGVRLAWSARMGALDFPLEVKVNGDNVTLASADGVLRSFDARSGAALWQSANLGRIAAGVGSDGRLAAVVTRDNELITLDAGRELWRQKLPAPSYTAPLVAGGRVFLLTADRSVSAFDGNSGRKLWNQQRPGEALVLRQAGVLLAVGETVVAGIGGRLLGLNPANGAVKWDAPIASPRGTNDIERRRLRGQDPTGRLLLCSESTEAEGSEPVRITDAVDALLVEQRERERSLEVVQGVVERIPQATLGVRILGVGASDQLGQHV